MVINVLEVHREVVDEVDVVAVQMMVVVMIQDWFQLCLFLLVLEMGVEVSLLLDIVVVVALF